MKTENIESALVSINVKNREVENIRILSTDDQAENIVRQALEKLIYGNCEFCTNKIVIVC